MFNLQVLASYIFPWFWYRLENVRAFVNLVVNTLGVVNTNTSNFLADTRQRVKVTSQRLSLESSLNDRFDPVQRRITVDANTSYNLDYVFNLDETITTGLQMFVFNVNETRPTGASERYVFNVDEILSAASGDIVAPTDLQGQENQIMAWVEAVLIFSHEYTLTFV